jgi:hypothetical protein
MEARMIPIHDLFESHSTVRNLERSMSFFGQTGLELAEVFVIAGQHFTGSADAAIRCSDYGRPEPVLKD